MKSRDEVRLAAIGALAMSLVAYDDGRPELVQNLQAKGLALLWAAGLDCAGTFAAIDRGRDDTNLADFERLARAAATSLEECVRLGRRLTAEDN